MKEMNMFDNPPRGSRRKTSRKSGTKRKSARAKRKPPAGFHSWKAYMASIRPSTSGGKMAKRKSKGRKGHRANPPRGARRHRRYRRNPVGSMGRGLVGMTLQGLVDGAGVLTGKVVVRQVPTLLKLNLTGPAAIGAQVAAAVVAGWAANKVKPGMGRMVLAGGIAAALEPTIKAANIPFVSAGLGDYYSAYLLPNGQMGLYPSGAAPSLAVPPSSLAGQRRFMGDYQEAN